MINLLPPENKHQIRAAQSNTLLLRYCVLSAILAFLLLAGTGAIYLMLNMSKRQAEQTIQDANQQSAAYQKSQQTATEFRNNLATAKAILDKEVRYSNIVVKIAQALPSGIVLDSLQLDAKTFGQPMTLNASGKTYDDAVRLKTALEQSSTFDNVNLQSVTQGDAGSGNYPVAITINVTINPEITKS